MFMVAAMMSENLFTKQTLQISSKPAKQVLHEWFKNYLGSKEFKSYLKTFRLIQHLFEITNELYAYMLYLLFLFN